MLVWPVPLWVRTLRATIRARVGKTGGGGFEREGGQVARLDATVPKVGFGE